MTNPSNPLLDAGLPAFGSIRPEHAVPAIEQRLADYQALLDRIEKESAESGDAEDIVAEEIRLDDALALAWSSVGHLHAVVNSQEWRAAYSECLERITAFYTARGHNRALFDCWRRTAEDADFENQPAAFCRMVLEEIEDFRLSGVDLDDPERKRFAEISMRLSTLGNSFGNHVLDATEGFTEHFESADALAGLPDSALDTLAARAVAADRKGWMADLSYPCYQAIATYADDRALRQRFYTAHATRASSQGPQACEHDNEPIVDEMLSLRDEQAKLLGFEDAAALKLTRRMAADADTVEHFLRDLAERARPAARRQLDELTEFARNQGGPEALEPWDIAYYSEKMREETLGLSQEKLKPWFELERTLDGFFGLTERLFGIRFVRDKAIRTWHEDVRFYRVVFDDTFENNQPDAGIYIDLYARTGKQGGAWMDVCRQRMAIDDGPARAPVAFLTCNFASPASGAPSLLQHDDVVTLFHEFGHCLHHLLTRVDWPPVAGISGVEWDAVELPSQLMEGWTWEPEYLDAFARHIETGEPLPKDWVSALNADRRFLGAMALTRQIEFALTDLALHRADADAPVAVMRRIHDEVAVTPLPEFNRFLMSFSHLFDGGYAAGYYSYLWAELLARDAFEMFRELGLQDRRAGARLRDEILAVGGSRPMHESWMAFRGREPALDALLDVYGIAA